MKRLIEQTACEHGKWSGECGVRLCLNYNHLHGMACFCPGGSSREVTVDDGLVILGGRDEQIKGAFEFLVDTAGTFWLRAKAISEHKKEQRWARTRRGL